MANSYDVSTVVSRSYISEQLQDQIQKGAENKNAEFAAQFQKESQQKGTAVTKTESSANSGKVKPEDKRENNNKRKEKKNGSPKTGDNKIDIKA